MSTRESLSKLLSSLPDEKVAEVLDFARLIAERNESQEWSRFGREHLSKAYGPNEPEYTLDDIKRERK